ncbi:hypothetical protein RZS08_43025 [Arthrospira platensis SPKY1]|nr:hypothetical protein [Arthrospira platensis SPKY1]
MKVKVVGRDRVKKTKKRSSKLRPLLDALATLEPGGDAIEVTYNEEKEINSIRTAIYQYNQEHGVKVRSGKDSVNKKIYFYLD